MRPVASLFLVPLLALAMAAPAHAEKVFRYAFLIAETGFDPAQISDLYSTFLIDNIFDSPLKYDYLARPSKLLPNTLSEMPTMADEGTLYTMKVKPGIYFADDEAFHGKKRELTAADYVYSIKRLFDPRLRSPNLYHFEGKIVGMDEILATARKSGVMDYDSEVEGLRTLDRYTFQVRLKQPSYNFLYYLAYCSLTCAVAREVGDAWGIRTNEHPVGTGPYRLTFWKRSSKMVFEKNPNYREEYYDANPAADDALAQAAYAANKGKRLPMIDRVEVSIIEEPQPRWLSFLNGDHDFMDRLPAEFANVAVPNGHIAPNLAKQGIYLDRQPGMELTYSYFAMQDPVVGGYTPD
ncbi:MAG TPA: ABC transporter substrate-binding protein, partial [Usitatibacter sp.]